MRRFLKAPSPAMVVALVALFISMGGVSYGLATGSIDTREIRNNTIRTQDVRNNQVFSRDIRNGQVLSRDVRDGDLRFRDFACPRGTTRFVRACFERGLRGAQAFNVASNVCSTANGRLPTVSELFAFRNETGITLANQEMSSNLFRDNAFRYIGLSDNGTLSRHNVNAARQFRCVVAMSG